MAGSPPGVGPLTVRALITGVLVVATTMSVALPAGAHTAEELDLWLEDGARLMAGEFNAGGLAEFRAMLEAHPWWYGPAAPTTMPPTASNGTFRGMGNGTSDVQRWASLVAVYWPADEIPWVLCMIRHESGGNSNALSYANSRGLLQLHAPSWAAHFGVTAEDLYNPEINLALAYRIRLTEGRAAWPSVC